MNYNKITTFQMRIKMNILSLFNLFLVQINKKNHKESFKEFKY